MIPVLVPYVRGQLSRLTQAALDDARARAEAASYFWACPEPHSYYLGLQHLWLRGQPFAIVEQDIVPWPGALRDLERCPEPWCAYRYDRGVLVDWGMGCMRFGAALLDPAVIEDVGELVDDQPARHWSRLDQRLYRVLQVRFQLERPHVHEPMVLHWKPSAIDYPPSCAGCGRPLRLTLETYRAARYQEGRLRCGRHCGA